METTIVYGDSAFRVKGFIGDILGLYWDLALQM